MTPEERTERIMKRMSISRRELAERLDISVSSLAMYFTGQHRIRRVIALAIQAVYGINSDWIMQGKRPVFVKEFQSNLSAEAMEMAVLYDNLPRRLRPVARTTLRGLKALPETVREGS